jgi:hypothetical protein
VHIQLKAGAPRALPLADVVTGDDGRFTLSNVNSTYPPYLTWFPPEEWLQGWSSLAAESGAEVDAGAIQLRPATLIRVAVELVGGSQRAPGDREPTIVLRHTSQFGPRILAQHIGPEMVLRGVSFDEGYWEVTLFANKKIEEYTAPFHTQLGRRDQKFTLRLLRDSVTKGEYSLEGKMEVSESIVPVCSRKNRHKRVHRGRKSRRT